ncbi:MAG: hypothetical protein K2Q15_12680, partial [Burkholderiales bacterium]|nr:hypothetical protein [Burkholderiales bacterium]
SFKSRSKSAAKLIYADLLSTPDCQFYQRGMPAAKPAHLAPFLASALFSTLLRAAKDLLLIRFPLPKRLHCRVSLAGVKRYDWIPDKNTQG